MVKKKKGFEPPKKIPKSPPNPSKKKR